MSNKGVFTQNIAFDDGSTAKFEIVHFYDTDTKWNISRCEEDLVFLAKIHILLLEQSLFTKETSLRQLVFSELPKELEMRCKQLKQTLRKCLVRPTKTEVLFAYKNGYIVADAKISKEDVAKNLHSRKKGRSAAIRNLMELINRENEKRRVENQSEWVDESVRKQLRKRLMPNSPEFMKK
jgi:hypothetical protein